MKIGTFLFALLLASPPLARRRLPRAVRSPPAPRSLPAQTAAEVQHGGADRRAGRAAARGLRAVRARRHHHAAHHRLALHRVPGWLEALGAAREYELPRWAPIHIGTLRDRPLADEARRDAAHRGHPRQPRAHHRRARARAPHARGRAARRDSRPASRRWCSTSGRKSRCPNLGHHGEKYAPFILTLFFFILFANLLGLIPYGSTATGNISVTATLAIITFIVVEIAGMRAQGPGYLNTIFYWNKDLPLGDAGRRCSSSCRRSRSSESSRSRSR